MRKPLGVIFDLDGTVMDERGFDALAGDARLLEFATNHRGLTAEDIQRFADKLNEDVEKLKLEQMVEFCCQSFQRVLFERLGVSFSIGYPEMEREFWNAAVIHSPSDGIANVLDFLAANKIKTGMVSNTSFSGSVLLEDLARFDLARRFSFVMSSADYGFRKPSRRLFEIAVKKTGVDREDIWFAGDRLDMDVSGALKTGLFPVWYNPQNRPNTAGYSCLEVKDWYEFRKRVESALSA